MNENVTESTHIKNKCNEIVTTLIRIRKQAGFTQQFMADWLNVSRKKINEFENGKFDFDLLIRYSEKLSLEIKIDYVIH